MATVPDLWGELDPPAVRTPATMLREQAALLGRKTNNLIEGRVETVTFNGLFYHSLYLVMPMLDDYTYKLLEVSHELREIYPVSVSMPAGPSDRVVRLKELKDERDFYQWLASQLSSQETKRVISNMLALAHAAKP